MGMDFLVGVKVKTTGAEKIDALEQKIEKLKSQNIDIKVNITGAEFLKDISKSLGSVNKFATSAGTSAGASYYNAMQQSARKTEVLYRDMWKRLSSQTNQLKLDQAANKLTQLSKNDMSAYSGTAGFNQYKANIAQATTLQERLNAEIAKGQNMNMDSFNADLKEMNSLLGRSATLYQNLTKPIGEFEARTASNKTLSWLNNNTKATKELGNAFVDLANKQKKATTVGELQKYNKEFTHLTSLAQRKGLTGNSFFTEISRGFKQIGQFVGTYGMLQQGVQIFKEMAASVREVDDATTELRKVSTASSQEIINYYDEAAKSAQKYGRSISEVINSTADWAKLGYNLNDAKVLSDVTSLYQNVGDNMTQESASKSLISTLQGFQLDASQAESIIDKFNEVANRYAIDTAGIGEALQRSAASFNAANTDISKSIALITGTNEVVQDPSVVGNMWKTVSMRIRSTKQELERAGEDTDGMVESTAELRDLVEGLTGFDIMVDEAGTQFKDIYDIIVGIGEKWHELTDVEQAGLLESLAGKRQGNALAAALNNIDTIKSVYNTSEFESANSAMKENERYMDSISGKMGQFSAQFQDLSNTFISTDLFKSLVDTGTGFLTVLTEIIDKVGSLPLILGGVGIAKTIKNFGSSNEFALYGCESIVA